MSTNKDMSGLLLAKKGPQDAQNRDQIPKPAHELLPQTPLEGVSRNASGSDLDDTSPPLHTQRPTLPHHGRTPSRHLDIPSPAQHPPQASALSPMGEMGLTPEAPRYAALALEQELDKDECSICLDNFSEEDPALLTRCGHSFHLQCVIQWSHRSRECPLCMKRLKLIDEDAQDLLGTGREESVVRTPQPATSAAPQTEADLIRMLQTLAVEARYSRHRQREILHGAQASPPPPSGSRGYRDRELRRAERERDRVSRQVQELLMQPDLDPRDRQMLESALSSVNRQAARLAHSQAQALPPPAHPSFPTTPQPQSQPQQTPSNIYYGSQGPPPPPHPSSSSSATPPHQRGPQPQPIQPTLYPNMTQYNLSLGPQQSPGGAAPSSDLRNSIKDGFKSLKRFFSGNGR